MNDERLAELKEKYKDRNLLEELAWGVYFDHSGYTSKQNGEFLNWLCLTAYKALKERPTGEWIVVSNGTTNHYACSKCGRVGDFQDKFCRGCGADMRKEAENEVSVSDD